MTTQSTLAPTNWREMLSAKVALHFGFELLLEHPCIVCDAPHTHRSLESIWPVDASEAVSRESGKKDREPN